MRKNLIKWLASLLTLLIALSSITVLAETPALTSVIDAKVSEINEGDTVTFGRYEQDANTGNGAEDIEWYVVEIRDGKAMLLSKYILDWRYYGLGEYWSSTDIQHWINGEFLYSAFDEAEQAMIVTGMDNNEEKITLLSDEYLYRDWLRSILFDMTDQEKYEMYWDWYLNWSGDWDTTDMYLTWYQESDDYLVFFTRENGGWTENHMQIRGYEKSLRKLYGKTELLTGYPTTYCAQKGYVWPTGAMTYWLKTTEQTGNWGWGDTYFSM